MRREERGERREECREERTGKTFVNKSFPKPFQKTLICSSPCGHGE